MLIYHITSEVAGFAKTGGLGDVCASLPPALADLGHDCTVIMPMYRSARNASPKPTPTGTVLDVQLGRALVPVTIWKSTLRRSNVDVLLIENAHYFERDDPSTGNTYYQMRRADGTLEDYPDNADRFALFCRAALELIKHRGAQGAIVHCHDWHASLVPVFVAAFAETEPGLGEIAASVLTIHNLAYQGVFPASVWPVLGLPSSYFRPEYLEFYGKVNFLKGGIVSADIVNTVSPTYAKEIQTPEFGCGLEGVLRYRSQDLYGIVNGVDYEVWDPSVDRLIPCKYDTSNVDEGKATCKRALQERLGLAPDAESLLLGVISRLSPQKGWDLILPALDDLLAMPVQLAILGSGEARYERALQSAAATRPEQIAAAIRFDEELAHWIEAGADAFLMPSLFEPCGLNQLYSLKYGTVPTVRRTGGLADTVTDANDLTLAAGTATGFVFDKPESEAMLEAVRRCVDVHAKHPDAWKQLRLNGMRQDWSWQRSAREYVRLYEAAVERRASRKNANT